jgi:hypothetical protein
MRFTSLSNPASIKRAVEEFDRIGRDAFLAKYGFGKSREFFLELDGKRYDSKAVIGAAFGYEFPDQGPLSPYDFSGGERTVQRKLEELGFRITRLDDPGETPATYTSARLTPGEVYAREDLKEIFEVTDATVNNGVFRPKGTNSVWLFVTREKPRDRTQYEDRLEGDTLYWQGQKTGRTDYMIVEHEKRDLELLLFFRARKYEHPGAAFRYEGRFRYVSHSGSQPANFVLQRIPPQESKFAFKVEPFDPASIEDGRERTLRLVAQRQGQGAFRDALLKAYDARCAMSGCHVISVLEAAHVHPYRGASTNHVTNGLLLRADLHTLFDLGLIAVDPEFQIMVSPDLEGSIYSKLEGRRLKLPPLDEDKPSSTAFAWHRNNLAPWTNRKIGVSP